MAKCAVDCDVNTDIKEDGEKGVHDSWHSKVQQLPIGTTNLTMALVKREIFPLLPFIWLIRIF